MQLPFCNTVWRSGSFQTQFPLGFRNPCSQDCCQPPRAPSCCPHRLTFASACLSGLSKSLLLRQEQRAHREASPHQRKAPVAGNKAWEEQNGSRKAQFISQGALFTHSFVERLLCAWQCCQCQRFAMNAHSGPLSGVSAPGLVVFTG